MRHYFKYYNGFINVDENNLYLTKSGNWKEVEEIAEKNILSIENNSSQNLYRYTFYWILYTIIIVIFFKFFSLKFWIFLAIKLAIAQFLLTYFYRRDFAKSGIIPLYHVLAIEKVNKKDIKISFRNINNEQITEVLKNVDSKGIDYLTGMVSLSENF